MDAPHSSLHEHQLRDAIQILAANLMYLASGAGKYWDVLGDVGEFADALGKYKEKEGRYPPKNFYQSAICVGHKWQDLQQRPTSERHRVEIEDKFISAALRISAGILLDNQREQTAQREKLYTAICEYNHINRTSI